MHNCMNMSAKSIPLCNRVMTIAGEEYRRHGGDGWCWHRPTASQRLVAARKPAEPSSDNSAHPINASPLNGPETLPFPADNPRPMSVTPTTRVDSASDKRFTAIAARCVRVQAEKERVRQARAAAALAATTKTPSVTPIRPAQPASTAASPALATAKPSAAIAISTAPSSIKFPQFHSTSLSSPSLSDQPTARVVAPTDHFKSVLSDLAATMTAESSTVPTLAQPETLSQSKPDSLGHLAGSQGGLAMEVTSDDKQGIAVSPPSVAPRRSTIVMAATKVTCYSASCGHRPPALHASLCYSSSCRKRCNEVPSLTMSLSFAAQ